LIPHAGVTRLALNVNLTEQQVEIIKNWAASSPYLQAVRLFGSYAKGSAHPEAFDIADPREHFDKRSSSA